MKKISLLVLLFLALASSAEPLKIGWGITDVSSDKPLVQYGRPKRYISRGLRDPLAVTTLVIDDGRDCVIFSTWDVCVTWGTMVHRVRSIVSDRCPEIPTNKIIFHSIHTHTGPAMGDGYDEDLTREYRVMFAERAAESITTAWKNRKPGKIGYGYDFAVTAFSRRPVYFDDLSKRQLPNGLIRTPGLTLDKHATLHGNSNDPMFSHMEAAPDPFVNFLFTYDMDDKLTGVVFNIAFPSQVSQPDLMLGSDCWSDIRREFKKKFGDGVHILPQVAAAGDLTFQMPYYHKARERRHQLRYARPEAFPGEFERKRCTEQMMAAFHRTLPWASKELYGDLPIRHITTTLHLKRYIPPPEDVAEAKENLIKLQEMMKNPPEAWQKDPKRLEKGKALIRRARAYCNRVLWYAKEGETKKTWPSEFHVLRIGDIAFVSERYELYTDYGQRIQARSPFTQTFTIQLGAQMYYDTGSAAHYLATARAFKNRGYQANAVNNSNAPSPEGGQQLVDEAVRLLYELKGEPEPKAPVSSK